MVARGVCSQVPERGMALLFANSADADAAAPLHAMWHRGCPVESGTKWIVTRCCEAFPGATSHSLFVNGSVYAFACVLVRTHVHMNDAYVLILSLGEPSLSVVH